jgi:hypothetical protein
MESTVSGFLPHEIGEFPQGEFSVWCSLKSTGLRQIAVQSKLQE